MPKQSKPQSQMRALRAIFLFAFLLSALSAQVQADSSQSVITFVQHFYDWYLPIALHNQKRPASTIAITDQPALFDATLLHALREDATAQAKAVGEIDGLDFDPFLNAQDPPTHYKVIRASGQFVTVVGFDHQISKPAATLAVEVHCNSDHCVLVNFHYPANGSAEKTDLIAILRVLHPHSKASQ